jgi:hypothetical protein
MSSHHDLGKAGSQTSLIWKRPLSIVPFRFGADTARGRCHDSHQETAIASLQSHPEPTKQISFSISVIVGDSIDTTEISVAEGTTVVVVVVLVVVVTIVATVVVVATTVVGTGLAVVTTATFGASNSIDLLTEVDWLPKAKANTTKVTAARANLITFALARKPRRPTGRNPRANNFRKAENGSLWFRPFHNRISGTHPFSHAAPRNFVCLIPFLLVP